MLSLIALSAALLQEPPAPPPPPPVEAHSRVVFLGADGGAPGELDADNDGQVTREEFAAPMNGAFDRLDKDADGRLSPDELARRPGALEDGVTIRRLGDGEVQRFELRRPGPAGESPARFSRDGGRTVVFISPDDDSAGSRVVVRPRRGGPGVIRFDGVGPGGSLPHGGRVVVHAADGPGNRDLDKDGDGKVSEAEFTAPLREVFARMDADRSGFIEEGERGRDGEVRVFTHRIETPDDE